MIQKYLQQFRKFKNFLGKEVWRLFFVSTVFGIFMFLIEASFIPVLQGFLQAIGLVKSPDLKLPAWYPTSLLSAVLILFTFGVARGVAYMIRSYLAGVTGQAFVRLQRSRTLEYALLKAEDVSAHQVITIFTERVAQAGSVLQSLSQLTLVGTSSFLFFAMGLKLAPIEMLIGLTFLGIFLVPLRRFNSGIKKAGDGFRGQWENVSKILMEGLRHHFLLKIYGLLDREIKRANTALVVYEQHYRSYFVASSVKNFFPNIIGIFVISSITYISIAYIHTPAITLISFFYLFIRLAQGASDANIALSEFRLHLGGFKEIYQWHERLSQQKAKEDSEKKFPVLPLSCEQGVSIQLKNVDFGYVSGPKLFNDLSLEVGRGQVLLIKGESGVGKSTLLMLVLGLLKPSRGGVLINGAPIESVKNSLFERVAYVGPEPYMIAGTIRENLLFGHHSPETVTDAEMKDALLKAQLTDERFALDYFIQEQTPMSTGQKQRLSIARGVVRKPQILILDEATANLDGETESKFIRSIEGILKEITTIIISHKSSFDKIATRTLELKKDRGGIC